LLALLASGLELEAEEEEEGLEDLGDAKKDEAVEASSPWRSAGPHGSTRV
jgi:hypothetical protein